MHSQIPISNLGEERGVVIATEQKTNKIAKAKVHREEAGLTSWIKLLEGDHLICKR
jgi:hypothetical protein